MMKKVSFAGMIWGPFPPNPLLLLAPITWFPEHSLMVVFDVLELSLFEVSTQQAELQLWLMCGH